MKNYFTIEIIFSRKFQKIKPYLRSAKGGNFAKSSKKKTPLSWSLKYTKFTNKALARKWVFSQAAQRETPLRSPSYLYF